MNDSESVFKALVSPVRREILEILRETELAAGAIGAHFDMSAPSLSRHLTVLKAAGLVSERRDGNRILYSLEAERLALSVNAFLSAVCPTQVVGRAMRGRPESGEGSGSDMGSSETSEATL